MAYYSGSFRQRGHGIGNIFGVLSRIAMPLLRRTILPALKRKGARAAMKYIPKVVDAGVGLMSDIGRKRPIGRAIRARANQVFGDDDGSINAKRPTKRRQSRVRPRASKKVSRSRKGAQKDIFS